MEEIHNYSSTNCTSETARRKGKEEKEKRGKENHTKRKESEENKQGGKKTAGYSVYVKKARLTRRGGQEQEIHKNGVVEEISGGVV